MEKMIYLDMDGTIANLYGVENWLDMLINSNPTPYAIANRIVEENILVKLVKAGYKLGIISWLSKNSTKEYDKEVRNAKRTWLKENYPNIEFSEIHIVKYGTPKYKVAKYKDAILFDDEEKNLNSWKGIAIHANHLTSFI